MKNLIVLMFASNNCYPKVVDYKPGKIKGLKVDLKRMTWTFGTLKENKIGESRFLGIGIEKEREGIIGIYTKDTKQIDSLVHDWGETLD